jgi:hypothetical protein
MRKKKRRRTIKEEKEQSKGQRHGRCPRLKKCSQEIIKLVNSSYTMRESFGG